MGSPRASMSRSPRASMGSPRTSMSGSPRGSVIGLDSNPSSPLAACCPSPARCTEKIESVQALKKRFCSDTVDTARLLSRKNSGNTPRKGKSKGRDQINGSSLREHYFGLPPIEMDYKVDHTTLPYVGFGMRLKRYIHKKTGMPRAVLILPKSGIPPDITPGDIDQQFQKMCKVDHPNVVPFREACEDRTRLKLIYEWADGGPLMHQLWQFIEHLSECHIAQIMRELLSALAAGQAFGLQHLDLGLFSIFLMSPTRISPIKVFGLGIAGILMPLVSKRKYSKSNKHYYASPELYFNPSIKKISIPGRHACDMWAVGAILYTLCSGRPPFGCGSVKELSARIQKGVWSFGIEFSEYTPSLKDLIEDVMKIPWQKRPTANVAMLHTWVEGALARNKDSKLSGLAMNQLGSFVGQDHCKQTVARMLTDIGLTLNAYADLEKMFRELDLNGDGTITLAELVSVSTSMPGVDPATVTEIVRNLDRNGNDKVDITEFITALVMEQDDADERLVKKAFEKMDRNGDARVTKKELFNVLKQYSGTIELKSVSTFVGKVDDDGDQKIDYREFMGLFPQVKNKNDELAKRSNKFEEFVSTRDEKLGKFNETMAAWLKRVEVYRDMIQMACGQRQPDLDQAAGTLYSYEKGHITEYDTHEMIIRAVELLKNPPGKHLTQAQKDRQKRNRNRKERGGEIMGLAILTGGRKKKRSKKDGEHSGDESEGSSGSEGEGANKKSEDGLASEYFKQLIYDDHREKTLDPEYNDEGIVTDYIYFLMKVKSEYCWQQPLVQAVEDLKKISVNEYRAVTFTRKTEVQKAVLGITDDYSLKVATRFEENGYGTLIPKDAKLLPVEAFRGKDLTSPQHLQHLEEVALPFILVFSWSRGDTTAQKIELMRQNHVDKLVWAGKFLDDMLTDARGLLNEVDEDSLMVASVEGRMPCPPPISHRYLKFCQGREVAEDAITPRSDEITDSDEENRANFRENSKKKNRRSGSKEKPEKDGVTISMGHMAESSMGSEADASGTIAEFLKGGRKIERNRVLMEQVKMTRAAHAKKEEDERGQQGFFAGLG